MKKQTIWKFEIPRFKQFYLKMQIGAEFLTVQLQYGIPVIWALVDPEAEMESVEFIVYGTGMDIHQPGDNLQNKYIGTWQANGGSAVHHLFKIAKA